MLSAEAVALAVAGLVAGATGSWSPCGFSMIETLGRGRATAPACAAFGLGGPLGGGITFAGLAALGALLHGGRALGVAAAIAVAGAALDAGGARIVPQIRRQVPEPWRRVLPLPLAAGLYGVLLGMGFTTYVLSFAVPALAAVSVALGDVGLGLVLGVAFGLGRALPIVVLAPLCEREKGIRAMTAMAERPGLLRAARVGGAAALVLCAVAFAGSAAQAATRPTVAAGAATDPTVAPDGTLAWQVPGGAGRELRDGALHDLAGEHPAYGGLWLALVNGDAITVTNDLGQARSVPAPGADAVAVSQHWLAWHATGPDRLMVVDLLDASAPPRTMARVPSPATLGRPSVEGDTLVYALAGRRVSAIRAVNLPTGSTTTLRRATRGALLTQPSIESGRLLYVRATQASQQLLLGPALPRARSDRDRRLLLARSTTRRDAGHQDGYTTQGRLQEDRHAHPLAPARYQLWSTALTAATAYVTRLRRGGRTADIVRVQL